MSFAGRCLQLKIVIVRKFPVDTQKGRGRDKKRQCKGSRHQRKCVMYNVYSEVFLINAKKEMFAGIIMLMILIDLVSGSWEVFLFIKFLREWRIFGFHSGRLISYIIIYANR